MLAPLPTSSNSAETRFGALPNGITSRVSSCSARLQQASLTWAASDLDFVVRFEELPSKEHADACFGLLEGLEDLFERRIDLLEDAAIKNPYLREAIEDSKRRLYEAA